MPQPDGVSFRKGRLKKFQSAALTVGKGHITSS